MKLIGLLGGMSWESTLEYYRLINERVKAKLGGLHSARCLISSIDFQPVAEMMRQDDWEGIARVLGCESERLKRAGAEFAVICTNTMHLLVKEIEEASGLEVLQIGEAVAKEILKADIGRVGLLGTRFTMEKSYYGETLGRYGVDLLVPSEMERDVVDRVIFEELCKGLFKEESRKTYIDIISRLQARGAEGIILGCTEIPLLIKQSDVAIPVFDTTFIHATAAADYSMA